MYSAIASALNHPGPLMPHTGLFNRRILRSLSRADVALDVVSPRPFAPPVGPYSSYASVPRIEDGPLYSVHRPRFLYLLPKRLFYGLAGDSFSKRVPRYVERTFETPDVVHACHVYVDGYGMLPYCRRHDVPLFVVAHGTILNSYDDLPSSVRDHVRETLRECTGVLCVSDALARRAGSLVDSSKVETVPLGADPDRFPVEQRESIRSELGIDADETVVLFVGHFVERKGLREIMAALSRLDVPDVTFVFIGHGGDMRSQLLRALRDSPYASRHVYRNLSPLAVRRWFAVADLLLLPSHTEGRPTVIYEAMASETAVLGSDVGGIPEQVSDGETGALVPARDAAALTDALRSLLEDPGRLREMGRAGHRKLLERGWTWTEHAERVTALHEAAIESSDGA